MVSREAYITCKDRMGCCKVGDRQLIQPLFSDF